MLNLKTIQGRFVYRREHEVTDEMNKQTFLLELPLTGVGNADQTAEAHLEAGSQFYKAVLSEDLRGLRERSGFQNYIFHTCTKDLRCSWIVDQFDVVLV